MQYYSIRQVGFFYSSPFVPQCAFIQQRAYLQQFVVNYLYSSMYTVVCIYIVAYIPIVVCSKLLFITSSIGISISIFCFSKMTKLEYEDFSSMFDLCLIISLFYFHSISYAISLWFEWFFHYPDRYFSYPGYRLPVQAYISTYKRRTNRKTTACKQATQCQ